MLQKAKNASDGFDLTLLISTFGLIGSLFLTIGAYRFTFPGGFSDNPDYWSAFGSFIGGIYGPLVSFVALIAILKTIKLQKVMLENQRHEFEKLIEAQEENINSQKKQIDISAKSAQESAVINYKISALKMVEHQINFYNSRLDSIYKNIQILLDQKTQGYAARTEQLNELNTQKDISMTRIAGLNKFIMTFSLKNHSSIEEIKLDITTDFPKAYEE